MILRPWDSLPEFMKSKEVKAYYDVLARKKFQLGLKRVFDIVIAVGLLIILFIPMLVVALLIKLDSPGPVFYRQERVTSYGRLFKIHKFRTMVNNADKLGATVTVDKDVRITKIGSCLRNLRIDEIPQLIDVITGKMSFVGTRPEATKYVKRYTDEMFATLLLPAGITSETSIRYKNEAELLNSADDIDEVYLKKILPDKMRCNLQSIKKFSFFGDILTMVRTVLVLFGKEYN